MYSELLVPTDGTKSMAKVIEHALDLAGRYDARIHVLHVVDTEWADLLEEDALREQLLERGQQAADDIAEQADHHGLDVVTAVREGLPHEIILEYARENDVDLIVMGYEQPGGIGEYAIERLAESLLGDTTDRVVRRASVPVMTVRV